LKERDHWQDLVVDGRIVLKWVIKKYYGNVDRIDLALHKGKWQAF
jgi:hypothetical protein